ncbi:unnamed protein product, partial [Lymnaea stagnalis]
VTGTFQGHGIISRSWNHSHVVTTSELIYNGSILRPASIFGPLPAVLPTTAASGPLLPPCVYGTTTTTAAAAATTADDQCQRHWWRPFHTASYHCQTWSEPLPALLYHLLLLPLGVRLEISVHH